MGPVADGAGAAAAPGAAGPLGPHRHSEVWSAAADRADTSVFVTPEYTHGVDALAEYAHAFVDVE